jgi:membrane-associated phospholipid phosphatase
MQRLGNIVTDHKWYFSIYFFVLLLTLIPQLLLNQTELFLEINALHYGTLDFFFYWITYFGDGLTFAILVAVLFFFSYRNALIGLIIFLSTAIFAQVLKRVFFADQFRPFRVLSEQYELYLPKGVQPIIYESFPSGHTVTAFALATFLVLTYHKKVSWFALLLLAWLTAYSRVYLTHHFPIDVWVGSFIGTVGGLLMFWLFADKLNKRFGNKSILNR